MKIEIWCQTAQVALPCFFTCQLIANIFAVHTYRSVTFLLRVAYISLLQIHRGLFK